MKNEFVTISDRNLKLILHQRGKILIAVGETCGRIFEKQNRTLKGFNNKNHVSKNQWFVIQKPKYNIL
jgi:S-adenosylmethionine:tRNA-ribosyltransferase-isomerase (queuine synthetase)